MVFTCDGDIFTDLTLTVDTSNDEHALLATFTADDAWEDAGAEVNISLGGKEKKEDIDSLCAYISEGECEVAGSVTLDLTSLITDEVPQDSFPSEATYWATVNTVIATARFEITVEQDGKDEKCTQGGVGQIFSGYHMAHVPPKTAGFAIGAAAFVGLALYAVKRRNRTSSKTGADEKLVEGELA